MTNVLDEMTTVANANLEDVLSELDGEIIGGSALTVKVACIHILYIYELNYIELSCCFIFMVIIPLHLLEHCNIFHSNVKIIDGQYALI